MGWQSGKQQESSDSVKFIINFLYRNEVKFHGVEYMLSQNVVFCLFLLLVRR